MQYVTTLQKNTLAGSQPTGNDYLMGHLSQKTYGLTVKFQVNVTPDISIQFYGSPFTSIGKYDDFKLAADTKSHEFEARTTPLTDLVLTDNSYTGQVGDSRYTFKNPNFSFNEFRSNLVVRWEYLRGSTLYLVWEHQMSNKDGWYQSGWGHNLDRMWGLPSTNTLMVKMNYWFNL